MWSTHSLHGVVDVSVPRDGYADVSTVSFIIDSYHAGREHHKDRTHIVGVTEEIAEKIITTLIKAFPDLSDCKAVRGGGSVRLGDAGAGKLAVYNADGSVFGVYSEPVAKAVASVLAGLTGVEE